MEYYSGIFQRYFAELLFECERFPDFFEKLFIVLKLEFPTFASNQNNSMLTRVFGVAITILSIVAIIVNTFLFLNSSAYFDYNAAGGKMSLPEAGVFYPYFVAVITLTFGILLVRDRELESDHH
jgi:hypothetical protein